MTARQLITGLIPLNLSDTCAYAQCRMEKEHLAQLPVTDGDAYVGLISLNEIQALEDPQLPAGDSGILQRGLYVGGDQHLVDAVRMFYIRNLNILPVVEEADRYQGVIHQGDAFRALGGLIGADIPASIIVLEIEAKNYLLSDIIRVVESNDARILGCFARPQPGADTLEVTLRVNLKEIGPLMQAFYRLNYQVKASWSPEDSFHEVLKDRFDALMNYLNI